MKLVQSTSLTMSSILLSYRWLLPAVFSTTNAATFASSDEANSLRLFWKFDDFPKVYTAIVPTGAPGDISGDDFVSSVDFLGVEEIITDEDGTRKAKVSFIVHDHWELMYVRYLARQNNVMFRGSKRSTKAASKIEVDDARTNDLHDELNYATNEEDSRVSRINEAYSTIGGYPCYKNVQGTFAWMNAMVERAASIPNLSVEIKDIGDSYLKSVDDSDGYDILAMVITGNGASSVQQKSIFFASTGIHAREYTPTELVSRWAEEDLINQYGVDVDITAMLDRTEIHLVIQANPDGRVLAETQKWQLRRKNANTKGRFLPCFLSTKGVDLNRNFPFRWDAPGGSSTNKCAQTYRGESPASEPETQAIVNYCKQIFPEGQRKQDPVAEKKEPYAEDTMGVFFDMHAYGEILIWPWSHENDRTANDEGFKALANKYKYFNDYAYAGPQEEAFLYEASGTTADWAYGVLGAAGMTFELGTSFYQQCDYFEDSILEKNKKALTYAAKISRAPYSLPKGPDIIDATLTVSSESSKEESLTISVSASDSSNTANAHSMAEQDVIEIRAFIDEHPYDLLEDGQSPEGIVVMEKASDGNSITVAGTKTIDISDLSGGKHVVYLIAKDSLSYSGPVTAYEFEKSAIEGVNDSECKDNIASNPACTFGGICDCESLVNLPGASCGGVYSSPMGMGEIKIDDVCPSYCGACSDNNNVNNVNNESNDSIVYAELGETCEGFDEVNGMSFPSCRPGMKCEPTAESSIPGADKTCVLVGNETPEESSEDVAIDNTDSNEDNENNSDQDEENNSNNNCEDKIASHPACTFGNICDCETLVNLPGSSGCGSILENPSGNLIINEWCPSYCNACPT